MARTRTLPDDVKARARELRCAGLSLRDVANALGLPKSTAQYILAGVRPSPEGVLALRAMRRRASVDRRRRLERARRLAAPAAATPEARARASRRARELALQYRPDELRLRAKLQAVYGDDLCKEAFDGVVLKACSSTHVVDWAKNRASVYMLPRRMAVVKSLCDKRKRVAYVPERYVNSLAVARLRKLRVEVCTLESLEAP